MTGSTSDSASETTNDEPTPAAIPTDGSPEQTPAPSRGGWWRSFRAFPTPVRWASYVASGVVLALIGTLIAGVVVARRPLPQITGTARLPGLGAPVEVIRDDRGIPQLYGNSLDDLMRAEGYVHAQERFYEMDVRRHLTAGRLSELFGSRALESDKLVRTLGWRRTAEQELALVSPETRGALIAYADGVNAYLHSHDPSQIAVQYTLLRASGLRYSPEDWTPADSLAWLKAMAWDLEGSGWYERFRSLTAVNHTDDELAVIDGSYPFADHAPIVAAGSVVGGRFVSGASDAPGLARPAYAATPAARRALAQADAALARIEPALGRGDGLGSNSWVVSGRLSETGQPILANDPHLGVRLPGTWMQVGLHCRAITAECPLDVAGFSFAGFPGVIIGHNSDIAWGFTNMQPDVVDYFLERVSDQGWRHAGKWRALQVRHEKIVVRDGKDFDLIIRSTAHGPLLSDVSSELSTIGANASDDPALGGDGQRLAVSLAWTGLRPTTTADAVLSLDAARNWADFRAAARDFAVPAQNLIYADVDGHIGYQAPGLIPIRRPGNDGRLPARGWRADNDWTGRFVPFDALPSELDPDEGFIVAANQAPIGPRYPYRLGDGFDLGYRSQRIRDQLTSLFTSQGKATVADFSALQSDDFNPMAPTLVPYLLDISDLGSPYSRSGQDLLRSWDFTQPADSAAAAYYNAVWANLLRLTFHDELRESMWPDGGDFWFAAVTRLLADPSNAWWDDRTTDEVRETRDDILRQALLAARDELTSHQSLNPDDWSWGRAHQLDLREPTLGSSGVGVLERFFNRTGFPAGGGASVVDANSWDANRGYQVRSAPSMRMVVSLADFDTSRWVDLTGVSGHPASSHYTDQTQLMLDGGSLPWAFSAGAVTDAGTHVLTLTPATE